MTYSESSSLFQAARYGWNERLRYLVGERHLDPQMLDTNGESPLHLAIQSGHLSTVRLLLELDVDVNLLTANGVSGVMYAVLNSNKQILSELLMHNAKSNAPDHLGQTPLMWASRGSHGPASLLLNLPDIDLEARDHEGMTALMHAAVEGNTRFVQKLLERGADPSVATSIGESASDLARRAGHYRLGIVLEVAKKEWSKRHTHRE